MRVNVTYGPPGTGKSRHLVEEVSSFLDRFKTKTAMMCSHTKAAAATIKERWAGNVNDKRLRANTLHSYCFEQLHLNRGQVVDDAKLSGFLNDFGLDMEPGSEGVAYMEAINYAAAMEKSPLEVFDQGKVPGTRAHFQAVSESYIKWKESLGYVDFNDMLVRYCGLNLAPQFQMLAIDEAQDLSILHWRVIYNMLAQKRSQIERILIVGDDDQALFTYAGVDPEGMPKFAAHFDAEVKVLGQSYRVPQTAHATAQKVIQRVQNRHPKEYYPTDQKGLLRTGEDIWRIASNVDPNQDTMILYSDRFRREMVESLLKEDNIPYICVSGFPAPLQTAAGRALVIANQDEITDEERGQIRRGLSARGGDVWDHVGSDEVIARLKDRDISMLKVHWSNETYFQNVPLNPEPKVRLSTIHGAKGMEAEVVHLCTGVSPAAHHQANLDPDSLHRLFYVGLTRTKHTMFIYEDDGGYEI